MELKNVEKQGSSAKLVLGIDREQFTKALDQAYKDSRKNIMVPGFRKGKAPRKIIEGMYGASVFYEDAINILFPQVWPEALEKSELKTVGQPSLEDMDVTDGALTLDVTVALYPEVTLGQYKGVEAEKEEVSIDEDAADKEIESMRERNSRLVSVERPIQDGDTAVIDFEGFTDGVAFEGGKGENHSLKIGSGTFVPGFEEQLIGASAGESRDVNITFPENYHEELAGKDATFKCFVHEVKENVKPELDDEFAKDVSEYDTLDELKNSINERLLAQAQTEAYTAFENAVLAKITENMEADIPEVMYEEQIDVLAQNFEYQLQMNGMNLQSYAQMLGMDVQSIRTGFRATAERQVKSELALRKIAKLENIEITQEDIEAEYKRLAELYSMEEERVRAMMSEDEMRADLELSKATKLVVEAAVPVAPAAKEDEEAAAEEPAGEEPAGDAE